MPADCGSRASAAGLELIEDFLELRLDLPLDARIKLAEKLAKQMSANLQIDLAPGMSHETFFEGLVHDLRSAHGVD